MRRPTRADNEPPLLKLKLTRASKAASGAMSSRSRTSGRRWRSASPASSNGWGGWPASGRWEIIFLTKRPEGAGATAQLQTQLWLESRGFKLPSVYVVQGSRGRIAAALGLDIVVDDRPENCLDVVVESKARAILIWRDSERQLPAAAQRLGIGVVKTSPNAWISSRRLTCPLAASSRGC